MPDTSDDYLSWFKAESRRWSGPGFVNLAGSAVAGNDAGLDELIACGRNSTADILDGHEGLRDGLASYFGVAGGADGRAARDCLLTTAGSSNALMIALTALRRLLLKGNPSSTPCALVESPTYRPLHDVAEYVGFETSPFRRSTADGYRLRTEAVREALPQPARPVVLVVSNLHNPTSAEASAGEVRALADVLPAGSYVLVDKTFINAGRGRDSVSRLGDPRLVALGSLSKDPGLGVLRCGWVVAFGDTLAEMRRAWVHGFNIGSPLTEAAACEAVRRLPAINERTERVLADNMKVAADALNPLHADGLISWSPPARGCVVFPELRAVSAERTFDARRSAVRRFYEHALAGAKVAVVPGDLFNPARVPDAGESNIRIGIGGPAGKLREGLGRLSKLIRQFSPA